jgi:hypothetical protein
MGIVEFSSGVIPLLFPVHLSFQEEERREGGKPLNEERESR